MFTIGMPCHSVALYLDTRVLIKCATTYRTYEVTTGDRDDIYRPIADNFDNCADRICMYAPKDRQERQARFLYDQKIELSDYK